MANAKQDGDVLFEPAYRQLAMLRTRKIGAVELFDAHLKAVAARNPAINAIVAFDEDRARAAVRAADAMTREEAAAQPLHGLPMTIKDSYEVAGMPATCGLPDLAGYRPAQDAVPVAKLRRAGAVIFGKTNVPAGVSDHQSYNAVYGLTRNPWNLERTVGGSSGGAAAALAAGLTALELGSDIGGSIRVPSHCCGVFGHKPSFGIVPKEGHIPPMPGQLYQVPLSVAGPMARSAHDLELMLDIVSGPGSLERAAWSLSLPHSRHRHISNYRVALWADASVYPLESASQAAIDAFARDQERLGVTVDRNAKPPLPLAESYRLYFEFLMGLLGARMPEDQRQIIAAAAARDKPDGYAAMMQRAAAMTVGEFMALGERQEQLFRAWQTFFRDYDVVICPVLPVVAFPHDMSGDGPAGQIDRRIQVDGVPKPYLDNLMWPGIATLGHLPATAIPTGRFVDGLPVGVQLIGPYLEDRTTLRLAQWIEDRLGGFRPPPLH
ncbi:MAG: amidase [Pseudomonadota bacterium]|nr:amidase [Pseudomonadota bacterium]